MNNLENLVKKFLIPVIASILITSLTFGYGTPVDAISVSGITGISSGAVDKVIIGAKSIREFNAAYMGSSSVDTVGSTHTFDSHFAWQSAQKVTDFGFANVFLNVAGFDLTFTVEDPFNEGYTLDAETLVRGYRTASLDACGAAVTNPYANANGSALLNVRLDIDGGGFGSLIIPLIPFGSAGGTSDKIADGIVLNDFTTGDGAATLGDFVGTHTFTLRVSNAPSSNTTLNVQNNCLAETAVRFGLNPTTPGFVHALTPGSDGETLSDLGLFVNVVATGHALPDADGDGFTSDVDCNDANPAVHTEMTYYLDGDGDTYGDPLASQLSCDVPINHVLDNTDCDDNNATIYPTAPELFDGLDNDCDAEIDEGILTSPAKGQRSDVNDFLIYAGPLESRTALASGTTSYDVMIKYGDTTDSSTFSAILNGVTVTHLFDPSGVIAETVSIPLEEGRNVLKLSIDGLRTDGRNSTDTDRLTFVVG